MKNLYSVISLNNVIKNTMSNNFYNIWVEGEVYAPKVSRSGHIYFYLKEGNEIINSVCWKGFNFKFKEGDKILCNGSISIYKSGYQLIVKEIKYTGLGDLLIKFEESRKRLLKEGVFSKPKKKIAKINSNIIIITSETGAVLHDIMNNLQSRYTEEVILYSVPVQGDNAYILISEAIIKANKDYDSNNSVIILARGGGSKEDLFTFNEEKLVRTIADSDIAIITAIGHETDNTLSDMASDLKVSTPTMAASIVSPLLIELSELIDNLYSGIYNSILYYIEYIENMINKMDMIEIKIHNYHNEQDYKLERLYNEILNIMSYNINNISNILLQYNIPFELINNRLLQMENNIDTLFNEIIYKIKNKIIIYENSIENLSSYIESNDYTKILDKGFALAVDDNSDILSSKLDILNKKEFNLILRDGSIRVKITGENYENQ